jgi:hypothetical protein
VLAPVLAFLNSGTGLSAHLLAMRKSLPSIAIFGSIIAVGAALFFFDPVATAFYPKCLFHELTGLYCPGCGSTRAIYCLLHGEFLDALRDNALVVLALPLLGCVFLARAICRRPLIAVRRSTLGWFGLLLAVIVFFFGVVRNIPRRPFSLLAPPAESAGK